MVHRPLKAGYLSKTETSKLLSRLREVRWISGALEDKVKTAFKIEADELHIYKVGGLVILEIRGEFIPTLMEGYSGRLLDRLHSMIVDMGAVPHIVNGADVMRPGVIEVDGTFEKGDILVVRDERNRKPIAIVRALVSHGEFVSMSRGKVAENIHHVNDKIWTLLSSIRNMLDR